MKHLVMASSLMLALGLWARSTSATPSMKCLEDVVGAAFKANSSSLLKVRIADEYFDDVHAKSQQECFVMTKGDVFDVMELPDAEGLGSVKIRDGKSNLFRFMSQGRVKILSDKKAQIRDEYFDDIHRNVQKTCFELEAKKTYQITGVSGTGDSLRFEIRDVVTDLRKSMPAYRVVITEPKIVKACPDLPARPGVSPGGSAR